MLRRPPLALLVATAATLLLLACVIGAAARGVLPGNPWPGVWHDPAATTNVSPPLLQSPAADDCHREPEVREVPGFSGDRQAINGERGFGGLFRRESRGSAEAGSPPVAYSLSDSFARQAEPLTQRTDRSGRTTVSAGMVDDNADFGGYLAYRQRHPGLNVRERDIGERYLIEVTDRAGRPVADGEVVVQAADAPEPLVHARTDTAGRVWLHPRTFLLPSANDRSFGIAVRKGPWQGHAVLRRGQSSSVPLRLGGVSATAPARLDLVFLIDATGSMGDEIAKLKASMRAMSEQIAHLPSRPDICWGLVAYRDRGDAFLTRSMDFTDRLTVFQQQLAGVEAEGGGDMPEALNEALHETVHGLRWRRDAVRLVVLVADAPPHLDYGGPQYDVDMQDALAKGIKVFAVGASGLDPTGEYVFRQIAQYTGGRFVFLTYRNADDPASGPGSETKHDVASYSVETLDRLVVKLVGEEMARLPPNRPGL